MQGRLAAAAASPGLGAVLGWGWGQGWDPAPGWDTSLAHGRCTYLSQTSWKDKVSVLNLKPPGHGTERIAQPNFPPLYLGRGESILERSPELEQSDLPEMQRVIQFWCRSVNSFKQEITLCLEKPPSTCNSGEYGEPEPVGSLRSRG